MKRMIVSSFPLFLAALIAASPVAAKTTKHAPKVSCKQVEAALATGKSPGAVAKDLHISKSRVTACTKSMAKAEQPQPSTKPK